MMHDNYLYPTLCLSEIINIYNTLSNEYKELYNIRHIDNSLLSNPYLITNPDANNLYAWVCYHTTNQPLSEIELSNMHPIQRSLSLYYKSAGVTDLHGEITQELIDEVLDTGFNSNTMKINPNGYPIPIKKSEDEYDLIFTRWKLKKDVPDFIKLNKFVFAIVPREEILGKV